MCAPVIQYVSVSSYRICRRQFVVLFVHAIVWALTLSILNRAWYWGTTALRGSVRMRTSVGSSRLCRGTTTGRRPTNSGIIPNSIRSRASTCFRSLSFSSISATASVSPLVLAKSAAAAARRPLPWFKGVPNPKYWKRGRGDEQQESGRTSVQS